MIRLTVSPKHPLTVIGTDATRYHFGQLISVTNNVIRVQLRRAVLDAHTIDIRSVIIETLARVTVEIDCRNISSPGSDLLTLEILEPPLLDIRVAALGN